jgi:membrane associated rhomboid family serine protease
MFRLTPIVKNLLIINVVIFLLGLLVQSQTGINYVNHYLALYYVGSDNFEPWQFVTYMFLHGDFRHIFGNMIGLVVFGTWLEDVWNPKRFLLYYMITGIGAGILFMGVQYFEKSAMEEDVQFWLSDPGPYDFEVLVDEHFSLYYNPQSGFIEQYKENPENPQLEREARSFVQDAYNRIINIPMVGASGAIFGILLAAGLLFPQRRIMLLIPPIPIRARILVILYGAYTVYAAFQRAPADNVAHFAHLGGMVVGFIMLKIWDEDRNRYY